MTLSPSKVATTADQAYVAIRDMMMHGDLTPGQRVSQRRLSRELGCSTVPVLEAMRRLESDGLLVAAPHCIARIRTLSPADLEGLYLVREGLEAVAARLAATRIADADLQRLRKLSDQFDEALTAADRRTTSRTDVALHKLIAESARCPLLAEELSRLMLIERTAGEVHLSRSGQASRNTSHRTLVQTLADRDADAAEYFMKKHIQAGYRDLVQAQGDCA